MRALAPLVLIPVLFIAVLRSGDPAPWARDAIPREPFNAEHCTWYCHNHGCRHAPRLPSFLTSDAGLHGRTIGALYRMGDHLVPGNRGLGYGAANLIVFCAAWPAAMYGLYLIALRQRRKLIARRRSRE